MARKLKVYRTPIGFHDAYVAAPSQKAALEAWGSDANLFARGIAEAVSDDELTRAPLANPGKVIKLPRGSAADYMAALPKEKRPAKRRSAPSDKKAAPPRRASTSKSKVREESSKEEPKPARMRKPKPRPSRAKLDAAERAIDRAKVDHDEAVGELRRREQALRDERRQVDARHAEALAKLEASLAKSREAYQLAIEKWAAEDR